MKVNDTFPIRAESLTCAERQDQMNSRWWTFLVVVAFFVGCLHPILAADKQSCLVTKNEKSFVPPAPYAPHPGLYGTADLWMIFHDHWNILAARKIPFFRQGYDGKKEGRPRLTLVARRLDEAGPLVWNKGAVGGHDYNYDPGPGGDAMITGLDLPSPGCWEFTAHYAPSWDYVQDLTFVAWVEP